MSQRAARACRRAALSAADAPLDDWEQWLAASNVKTPKKSAGIGFSE